MKCYSIDRLAELYAREFGQDAIGFKGDTELANWVCDLAENLRADLAAANARADGLEAFARKAIALCATPEPTKFYNDVTYLIIDTFGAVDMTKAALDGGEGE